MNQNLVQLDTKLKEVPSRRRMVLNININRYITDANGSIIPDANVPAIAPAMVKNYPFHIFARYDKTSGYRIADNLCRAESQTNLFAVYTWGENTPLFFFSPLADINTRFQKGDIVLIYVDDMNAPNYFSFVGISDPQAGYASFLESTNTPQLSENNVWGAFKMLYLDQQWSATEQLNFPLLIITTALDGKYKKDSLSPAEYYYPTQKQEINKARVMYEAVVNQYFGISGFIAFENNSLTYSIFAYV